MTITKKSDLLKVGDILQSKSNGNKLIEVLYVDEGKIEYRHHVVDVYKVESFASKATLGVSTVLCLYTMWRPAATATSPGVLVVPSEMVDKVRHIPLPAPYDPKFKEGQRVVVQSNGNGRKKGDSGVVLTPDALGSAYVDVRMDNGVPRLVHFRDLKAEETENVLVKDLQPGDVVDYFGSGERQTIHSTRAYLAASGTRYQIILFGNGEPEDKTFGTTAYMKRVKK